MIKIVLKKPTRTIMQIIRLGYWRPKRLTLKCNPRIHAFLWWNF
jgi:hypothetical protein